jgi:hypothetical protein
MNKPLIYGSAAVGALLLLKYLRGQKTGLSGTTGYRSPLFKKSTPVLKNTMSSRPQPGAGRSSSIEDRTPVIKNTMSVRPGAKPGQMNFFKKTAAQHKLMKNLFAPIYQDADGNTITKAEYDRLMAEANIPVPVPSKAQDYKGYGIWTYSKPEGGVLYLINYESSSGSCDGVYDTMAGALAAVDEVVGPVVEPMKPPTPFPADPVKFVREYKGHIIYTVPGRDSTGAAVYAIDVPKGGTASGGDFTWGYKTLDDAMKAIDNATQAAKLRALQVDADARTAAQNAAKAGTVSFAQNYKGHTISTRTNSGGGAVYIIDRQGNGVVSGGSYNFMPAYPTMADAQAAIDRIAPVAAESKIEAPTAAASVTAPTAPVATAAPTAATSTSGTVSFAQAYRGHAISTLTKSGGGVSYLIDVPQGSDGSGFTPYSTMPAAQAAIDASMPQPQQAASVYEPQQSPGLPVPQYTVQTPSAQEAPAYAAPVEAPAPANKTAGFVIGGGILAAAAALLLKR